MKRLRLTTELRVPFNRALAVLGIAVLSACSDRAPTAANATVPTEPQLLVVPTAGYKNVSVGASYGCALRADNGAVVCWGNNNSGQASPPTGGYTQVSAGLDHACAVRASDAAVVCWGSNASNQRAVPAGAYLQVSAGNSYSCAVGASDRAIVCWGASSFGKDAAPAGQYTQVSTGDFHTCAVTAANGAISCWGFNSWGQSNPPADAFTQVSAGELHTCGVRASDGAAVCWGSTYYDQSPAPSGVYTQVSAGSTNSCAVRTVDAAIVCWGNSRGGVTATPAGAFREVSVGVDNACAVRASDGGLVCWGNNTNGQSTPPAIPTKHVTPSAKFTAPAFVTALDSFTLTISGAQVAGYPQATSFTYRFDCGDGKGYTAASSTPNARCATRVAGRLSVRGRVIDQDGDTVSYARPVQVEPRTQTLSFTTTAPSPAYVSATYAVGVKATSGLLVLLRTSPPNVCTVNGSTIALIAAGTCTVTADQAGDSTYHSAMQVRQSFVVVRRPQAITFSPTLPTSALMGSAVTLSATGGASGNPVVFTSLTPGTCTVSGTTAQMTAAGSCIVAANQAGNTAYSAAPQVTRTIAVVWPFSGFFAPVQNAPLVNAATPGRPVDIPFSLGGNRGLNVLATGSPSSQVVACDPNAVRNKVGASKRAVGLIYDAVSARYTFTWATDAAWAGTCRTLTLNLADGTTRTLRFSFK